MTGSSHRPDDEELHRLYVDEELSAAAIAEELSRRRPSRSPSPRTVNRWLHDAGVPVRTDHADRIPRQDPPVEHDRLENMYVAEGKSTYDIADEFDVSSSTISNWLVRYGIPRRPSGRRLATDAKHGYTGDREGD